MRYLGWISTGVALGLAAMLQGIVSDESTRVMMIALPTMLALFGWFVQIVTHLNKVKSWVAKDVKAAVVPELKREIDELEKSINAKVDKMEDDLADRVVNEIWHRLDTIKYLTKRGDA